jgi:hypothetical protein
MSTGHDEHADLPRDAHLRQALRHAPDADAAPPPGLSAGILAQARAAVRPTPAAIVVPWWQRLWSQMATPAFGGAFASLMLAGVIGVLWQDGPPPEALPDVRRETARAPSVAAPASEPPAPAPALATATAQARPPADTLAEAPLPPPTQAAESRATMREAPIAARPRAPTAAPATPPAAPPVSAVVDAAKAEAESLNTAPGRAPMAAPAVAAAPVPEPAALPAPPAAPAAPAALAAPAPAKARTADAPALRDTETRGLMARRDPATGASRAEASAAPLADPLAAPWAALAGAAADDQRSAEARDALLEARRIATGPWVVVEALAADQGRPIVAPDGRPLGRLHVDAVSVTWQGNSGPAWRSPRTAVPR